MASKQKIEEEDSQEDGESANLKAEGSRPSCPLTCQSTSLRTCPQVNQRPIQPWSKS